MNEPATSPPADTGSADAAKSAAVAREDSATEPPVLTITVGTPIWFWPLLAINTVMEWLLGLMGPIGATMMHPTIRQILGWIGVMLLTASAVWSAVSLGWIPGVR